MKSKQLNRVEKLVAGIQETYGVLKNNAKRISLEKEELEAEKARVSGKFETFQNKSNKEVRIKSINTQRSELRAIIEQLQKEKSQDSRLLQESHTRMVHYFYTTPTINPSNWIPNEDDNSKDLIFRSNSKNYARRAPLKFLKINKLLIL